jgi:hypothetical protein
MSMPCYLWISDHKWIETYLKFLCRIRVAGILVRMHLLSLKEQGTKQIQKVSPTKSCPIQKERAKGGTKSITLR